MPREDGGYWLPIHTGLLRDERWATLSPAHRGAWVTLFLLLDAEPRSGWFRDRDRIKWLLAREGFTKGGVDAVLTSLDVAGWFVPEGGESTAITLRGWSQYTGTAARKAVYNRTRTDRGDRSVEYSRTAANKRTKRRETEGDGGRPRRDETSLPRPLTSAGEVKSYTGTKSFKEVMVESGLDQSLIPKKHRRSAEPDPTSLLTDTPEAV